MNVCSKGFVDIAALLLEQGADVELTNKQGVWISCFVIFLSMPSAHTAFSSSPPRKLLLMWLPRLNRLEFAISSFVTLRPFGLLSPKTQRVPRTLPRHPRCSPVPQGLKLSTKISGQGTWGSTPGWVSTGLTPGGPLATPITSPSTSMTSSSLIAPGFG